MPKNHKNKKSDFKEVFTEYYPLLVVFAKKYVLDLDTAREIVQDLFVKFYEKNLLSNIETSIKAYLYLSVRNACLNYIKSQKTIHKHHEEILFLANDDNDWMDYAEQTEMEEKVFKAISNLPPECADIFKMSRFEGIKNKEIAEKKNISIRTVETQISKAIKRLKSELKEYLGAIVLFFIALFS